jgi:hypothetical protein
MVPVFRFRGRDHTTVKWLERGGSYPTVNPVIVSTVFCA